LELRSTVHGLSCGRRATRGQDAKSVQREQAEALVMELLALLVRSARIA